MPKVIKLTKKSQEALDTFDEAACEYGWASDQGSQERAEEAEVKYVETAAALIQRIAYLERSLRNARRRLKENV
jgi:hypothetical protein